MDPEMYEFHDRLEESYWWFVARRRIVMDLLRRHVPADDPLILDLGCGTGGTLPALESLGRVVGVDVEAGALAVARTKAHAPVAVAALPDAIPFSDGRFDVVTLLDVLEHVENDVAALERIREILSPTGILVVTVPAFRFLWSAHDVVNRHFRRYRLPELREKLERAGFETEVLSYYNTLLFAPIAAVRLAERLRSMDGGSDGAGVEHPPELINKLLTAVFGAERWALGRWRLPWGVSLIAIARPSRR